MHPGAEIVSNALSARDDKDKFIVGLGLFLLPPKVENAVGTGLVGQFQDWTALECKWEISSGSRL